MKRILIIAVLFTFSARAQQVKGADTKTFTGKKGIYAINYDGKTWQQLETETQWDAEFKDSYNLVSVYYKEFDNFFPEKSIKTTLEEQYAEIGKVKNLKIAKKKFNGLEVNYFECEVEYAGFDYVFQGFIHNGLGGAVEIQFGVQKEGQKQYQKAIDTFCQGFQMLK